MSVTLAPRARIFCKRFVTRSINERDQLAVFFDLVSANVLSDTTSLALHNASADSSSPATKSYRDPRGPGRSRLAGREISDSSESSSSSMAWIIVSSNDSGLTEL